jgi:LacI family transcriptional regulator
MSRRVALPKVTIRDVARLAGVSATSVSNVLNDRTHAMTAATLARIQAAMVQLDYHPSHLARSLVTSRTATVGLIITEIETPLFLQAIPEMEALGRTADHNLLLCVARSLEQEEQAVRTLLEKQVDAVIFLSSSEYRRDDHLLNVRNHGYPLVLINRSSRHADVDQINWDQTLAVRDAVVYLHELGHRRIAHLTGPAVRQSTVERLDGYRQGLDACGLVFSEAYVQGGDFTGDPAAWVHSAELLLALSEPPTAIIAADDNVAAVVITTIQNAGLRVPKDISVMGIDCQPFSSYLNPALTTIALPIAEAGRRAMELALQRIAGDESPAQHVTIPCPLVVRASCAAAPSS